MGEAVGVDVSEPFIELAQRRRREAGRRATSASGSSDVQVADLGGPYDYAFSRMGMMFFANPVAALRNVREAMRPGGRLASVVWRRKLDNDWLYRAELVVEQYLEQPEETDEPTCGPGPFSMANADTLTEQLLIAGFEAISLRRCDLPIRWARPRRGGRPGDGDRPAGEVLRLWGDRAEEIRPRSPRDPAALAQFETEGVLAPPRPGSSPPVRDGSWASHGGPGWL